MNNEQFRRLLLANSQENNHQNGSSTSPPSSNTSKSPVAPAPAGNSTPRTLALGSKARSSIPMTPRSVAGFNPRNEFARQLAERNQTLSSSSSSSQQQHPNKKIRTSAPKGSRLAEGYVDRVKQRQAQEEADERERKLKELEERYKKEEIDKDEYERLRVEIIGGGGGLDTAHLVKGLDFKLLERVRRGEVDVFGEKKDASESESPEVEENQKETEENEQRADGEEDGDADDVLEQLESAKVKAKEKEKVQKKGEFATTTLLAGAKKTRNQILAELKAARAAAKAKQESSLGSRFKKIGPKKQAETRIERDDRGNEIMIIVDEDGNERRKVRRLDPNKTQEEYEKEREALAQGKVLGMDVPEYYKKLEEEKKAAEAAEEDKEPNIFDDVESDYDPLAGLESGSDDESDKEDGEVEDTQKKENKSLSDMRPPPKPEPAAAGPRNYFKDSKTGLTSQEEYKKPSLDDPSFRAALAKAKAISAAEKSEEERLAAEREARLRKKLLESSRDDEDLDMGFGSSRMEDDADLDESSKVKLSEWGEDEDDDGYEGGGKAGLGSSKGKRKRGGGKKGGDKNNFADVMKVIEKNKAKE
ncbi:uncharacterized protein B0T23DRAFT_385018 [Neurospora hispaniola]|uniref:RED-like N-terminal domain-containing protein n=1 Tax=Neurospora hispaniola TaxID=588809 RepID=A0AAJ0MPS1_9PEZI|nr:hypothetical protein B0T23DRAFT_385018 [Neurospora hispaniola]